jgi:hypothetical protein
MVLVDYIGIFFTCGNTFGHMLYMYVEKLVNHAKLLATCCNIHVQHVAKSIATCKKNPYVINQNHIFSKNYCEVISGYILTNFTPKHLELSIF